MDAFQQLMNEQAAEFICGPLGHGLHFVLPLQIRHATREVFCVCTTCSTKSWVQLPPEGFKEFLEDAAAGKIK